MKRLREPTSTGSRQQESLRTKRRLRSLSSPPSQASIYHSVSLRTKGGRHCHAFLVKKPNKSQKPSQRTKQSTRNGTGILAALPCRMTPLRSLRSLERSGLRRSWGRAAVGSGFFGAGKHEASSSTRVGAHVNVLTGTYTL